MTDPKDWLTREQVLEIQNHVHSIPNGCPANEESKALCAMAIFAIEARERDERPCDRCKGKRWTMRDTHPTNNPLGTCPACNGTGRKP